jgi:hypothetical protein
LNLGEAFARNVRHFWPDLNDWLDRVPDARFQPYVTYDKRFLVWWGLALYLFQLGARLILQVFEAGSLLRHLAAECDRTPWQLFGGLKNLAHRLLESFRYRVLSDEAFDPNANERIRIGFDSS